MAEPRAILFVLGGGSIRRWFLLLVLVGSDLVGVEELVDGE